MNSLSVESAIARSQPLVKISHRPKSWDRNDEIFVCVRWIGEEEE